MFQKTTKNLPAWRDDLTYIAAFRALEETERARPKLTDARDLATRKLAGAHDAFDRVDMQGMIGRSSAKDVAKAKQDRDQWHVALEQAKDDLDTNIRRQAAIEAEIPNLIASAKATAGRALVAQHAVLIEQMAGALTTLLDAREQLARWSDHVIADYAAPYGAVVDFPAHPDVTRLLALCGHLRYAPNTGRVEGWIEMARSAGFDVARETRTTLAARRARVTADMTPPVDVDEAVDYEPESESPQQLLERFELATVRAAAAASR
jgi:hypothetical protein